MPRLDHSHITIVGPIVFLTFFHCFNRFTEINLHQETPDRTGSHSRMIKSLGASFKSDLPPFPLTTLSNICIVTTEVSLVLLKTIEYLFLIIIPNFSQRTKQVL